MSKSAEAIINPALLLWARESAGMGLEEAARRLGVSAEKLSSWEKGQTRPTVKKLLNVASVYKQTFAAFYLDDPPDVFHPPVKDYRRLPSGVVNKVSADLSFDVRLAMDRRAVSLELLAQQNEKPPLFNSVVSMSEDPEQVATRIRTELGIDFNVQARWRDNRSAFNAWREAVESQGVLVFQAKSIALTEMRGYSIAESPLPVVVVNRKDAYAGRAFTLMHEFAHLMLRASGVCNLELGPNRTTREQRTEIFCNHVAGAVLVPKSRFLAEQSVRRHKGYSWKDEELELVARNFSVSREVILRRALILGLTDEEFYSLKREQLLREYEVRTKGEGFIPPHTDVLSLSGKPFVKLVLNSYYSDKITASDVSEYLGLKLQHLEKINHAVGL